MGLEVCGLDVRFQMIWNDHTITIPTSGVGLSSKNINEVGSKHKIWVLEKSRTVNGGETKFFPV